MDDNQLKDHRKIGQEQDLFHTSELVGPGLPLFTPKGTVLRKIIEDYISNLLKEEGYQNVWTPHIARKALFEKSRNSSVSPVSRERKACCAKTIALLCKSFILFILLLSTIVALQIQ